MEFNKEQQEIIDNIFGRCFSLESDSQHPFDISNWDTSALTSAKFIFASLSSERSNWYNDHGWNIFSRLTDVRLPSIPDNCDFSTNFNRFYGGQDNFEIENAFYEYKDKNIIEQVKSIITNRILETYQIRSK